MLSRQARERRALADEIDKTMATIQARLVEEGLAMAAPAGDTQALGKLDTAE
jgi:hypothetical protein